MKPLFSLVTIFCILLLTSCSQNSSLIPVLDVDENLKRSPIGEEEVELSDTTLVITSDFYEASTPTTASVYEYGYNYINGLSVNNPTYYVSNTNFTQFRTPTKVDLEHMYTLSGGIASRVVLTFKMVPTDNFWINNSNLKVTLENDAECPRVVEDITIIPITPSVPTVQYRDLEGVDGFPDSQGNTTTCL